ncbi:hypothetical protein VNO80_29919 [Phaseolus coccineus]|uniref:Uncharacterized protein n=1 Tax=Phaseolus coccineus TaxID=3886 RepID=A0AAN9QCX3_PHACN
MVTSFPCGGFTIEMGLSHVVCEGMEHLFFRAIMKLARRKSEPYVKPMRGTCDNIFVELINTLLYNVSNTRPRQVYTFCSSLLVIQHSISATLIARILNLRKSEASLNFLSTNRPTRSACGPDRFYLKWVLYIKKMAQNVSFCLFNSVTLTEALVRLVPELVVAAINFFSQLQLLFAIYH